MKEQSPNKFYTKKVQSEIDNEDFNEKELINLEKLIQDSKKKTKVKKSNEIIVSK